MRYRQAPTAAGGLVQNVPERCGRFPLALREFGRDVCQQRADSFFGQGHDPAQYAANTFRIARIETAEKNARLIGL